MRVSTLQDDPGYAKWRRQAFDVFLDGRKVDEVFTADEEQGLVICVMRGHDGKIKLDGDQVAMKTLHGAVSIVARRME